MAKNLSLVLIDSLDLLVLFKSIDFSIDLLDFQYFNVLSNGGEFLVIDSHSLVHHVDSHPLGGE